MLQSKQPKIGQPSDIFTRGIEAKKHRRLLRVYRGAHGERSGGALSPQELKLAEASDGNVIGYVGWLSVNGRGKERRPVQPHQWEQNNDQT